MYSFNYLISGIWTILIIPAIIFFIFCIWVTNSIVNDVNQDDQPSMQTDEPDTVILKIYTIHKR